MPAGSVAVPLTVIEVPSTSVAPMLTMVGLGATLATLIVCVDGGAAAVFVARRSAGSRSCRCRWG